MTEEVTMEENENEIKDPQGLLKAYDKAKADIVAMREENKKLKAQIDSAQTDDAADAWKQKAVSAETRLALQAEGVKDVDRLIGYVGTEGIDFNEEGGLTGLQERIDSLKTDLPELFDVKRRVGGRADIFADSPSDSPPSASDLQAQSLLG